MAPKFSKEVAKADNPPGRWRHIGTRNPPTIGQGTPASTEKVSLGPTTVTTQPPGLVRSVQTVAKDIAELKAEVDKTISESYPNLHALNVSGASTSTNTSPSGDGGVEQTVETPADVIAGATSRSVGGVDQHTSKFIGPASDIQPGNSRQKPNTRDQAPLAATLAASRHLTGYAR